MSVRATFLAAAAILVGSGAIAADNPPLSAVWNVAPTGQAATSGELRFRMTPADGSDPVEITVPVIMGARDTTIARNIRSALGSQLRPDHFDVKLGEGTNVLVTDAHGKPNFSLQLIDSDVENLRVAVQSVAPAASPTVQEQALPANAPGASPPRNTAPGNAIPPPASSIPPPTSTMPPPTNTMPPPTNTMPPPSSTLPPPANTIPVPTPASPPENPPQKTTPGGAGEPATTPPPHL